jgi:hypothetical protein
VRLPFKRLCGASEGSKKARVAQRVQHPRKTRREEGAPELLFPVPNAHREAQNLLRRQTAVLSLAMRPMPLGVVIFHEAFVHPCQFLSALGLGEVEVGHPALDVERCFYITLPGSSALYLVLGDAQGLVDVHSQLGAEGLPLPRSPAMKQTAPLRRSEIGPGSTAPDALAYSILCGCRSRVAYVGIEYGFPAEALA